MNTAERLRELIGTGYAGTYDHDRDFRQVIDSALRASSDWDVMAILVRGLAAASNRTDRILDALYEIVEDHR